MHILEFYSRLKKDGKEQHRVKYAPSLAEASKLTCDAPVESLRPKQYHDNPRRLGDQVQIHWEEYFGPAYEAWLKGNDIPANGTSLTAWPAVTKPVIDQFRMSGIASIEDLAQANESVLRAIRVPNVRQLQTDARKFLELKDVAAAVHGMSEKDDQIAVLSREIESLKAAMEKPKRGRPKKEETLGTGD